VFSRIGGRVASVGRTVLLGALAVALAGCADPSGIQTLARLRQATDLGLGSAAAQQHVAEQRVAASWWLDFGDEQLNTLMAQALADSPSLRLAESRLARAQAALEVADAGRLPQVNGQIDLTRQRYTAQGLVPPPLAGSIRENGTAQFSGSWEIDFFGRYRSALDAALGAGQAAEADVQAARVLLASSVARSYFQWVRLVEQAALARRTLAQRSEVLALVQARVNAGLDSRLELRQSQAGLPQARLALETIEEQVMLARHALAALTGRPLALEGSQPAPLSRIRQLPLASVIPADLLGLRPDIAAARWRVQAASSDVQNARAQFYPNINLVGFAGFSSIGFSRLSDSASQQWGVGPALRLPIFDAGRLRANLRVKAADHDAAVESYNAAVTDAVREVADQAASSHAIARQQAEQRQAQEAAEDSYEIALQRYRGGLGNYLSVLASETAVLEQRRAGIELAARVLDGQVALVRALGGSYVAPVPQAPVAALLPH
jgi:NodT family efflux transporter outer membrane factor (OMF) lipoprotein